MSKGSLTQQYRHQQWRAAIQDQKASGLTIKEWCKEHGISEYRFYYRQRVLRDSMTKALEEHLSATDSSSEKDFRPLSEVKSEKTPPQVSFAQVPERLLSCSNQESSVVMRLQTQNALIEISHLDEESVLSFLREVALHG